MSSKPPCPCACTAGTPRTCVVVLVCRLWCCILPGRSVMSSSSSLMNCSAHGCSRPASTRSRCISPCSVGTVCAVVYGGIVWQAASSSAALMSRSV